MTFSTLWMDGILPAPSARTTPLKTQPALWRDDLSSISSASSLVYEARLGLQRLERIFNLRLWNADVCPRVHEPDASENAPKHRSGDVCNGKRFCIDAARFEKPDCKVVRFVCLRKDSKEIIFNSLWRGNDIPHG